MHTIYSIIQEIYNIPILTSTLLGILVSISPCTIAANITALSILTNSSDKGSALSKGMMYALGRALLYTCLGVILYFFADSISFSAKIQAYFGMIIGPLFIVLGIFMMDLIHLHGFAEKCVQSYKIKSQIHSNWSALGVGIILALAFCPYSGALYFGALMPLTLSSAGNPCLPLCFAVGSSIPLIPIVFLVSKGVNRIQILNEKYKNLEKITQRIIAVLFIIAGIMFINEYYFE